MIINGAELAQMSADTTRQRENLEEVIQSINTAITGTQIQSTAVDSYKERWSQHQAKLDQLAENLTQWSKTLQDHSGAADALDTPLS